MCTSYGIPDAFNFSSKALAAWNSIFKDNEHAKPRKIETSLSLSHRSFHSNFLVITILAVPSIINYTLPSFIFSGVKFEVYEFAVYPNLGTKPGYQMRGSGSMKPFFLENKKDKKTK